MVLKLEGKEQPDGFKTKKEVKAMRAKAIPQAKAVAFLEVKKIEEREVFASAFVGDWCFVVWGVESAIVGFDLCE